MFKKFLNNEGHTFTVATIAIVFQSVLTILISAFLIYFLAHIPLPIDMLLWLLCIDVTFVCLHLAYRRAYSGPKVILQSNQKKTLYIHIVTSLIALSLTSFFVLTTIEMNTYSVLATLFVWLISLISGVVFFTKKYSRNVTL